MKIKNINLDKMLKIICKTNFKSIIIIFLKTKYIIKRYYIVMNNKLITIII